MNELELRLVLKKAPRDIPDPGADITPRMVLLQITGMIGSVEYAIAEYRLDADGDLWEPEVEDPAEGRECSAPFRATPYAGRQVVWSHRGSRSAQSAGAQLCGPSIIVCVRNGAYLGCAPSTRNGPIIYTRAVVDLDLVEHVICTHALAQGSTS